MTAVARFLNRPSGAGDYISIVLYVGVLVTVSVTPGTTTTPSEFVLIAALTTPTVQNYLHVPAYALLALLCSRASQRWTPGALRMVLSVGLAATAFGALLEWIQFYVPGRFPSREDIVFNALGAFSGAGIFVCLQALYSGHESSRPGSFKSN